VLFPFMSRHHAVVQRVRVYAPCPHSHILLLLAQVGEVWYRVTMDVATGSKVVRTACVWGTQHHLGSSRVHGLQLVPRCQVTHVLTITRVDPQQDTLMGLCGLVAGALPPSEESQVLSFSEYAAVSRAYNVNHRRGTLCPPRVHLLFSIYM
jgi:hypothetical protein